MAGIPGFSYLNNLGNDLLAGRIDGPIAANTDGMRVAAAGDVNGDGYADLVIGVPLASQNGRASSGSAYVVYGGATPLGTVDLAALTAAQGFRIDGSSGNDLLGSAVSSAGDVNGDGIGDLLIGAYQASPNGRAFSGSAYVILGKNGVQGNIDLATPLTATQGYEIQGASAFDGLGTGVAAAGDFNADGFGDIVVSAPSASLSGRANDGAAYIIYGKDGGFGALDLSGFNALFGLRLKGAEAGDQLSAVASAGDLNGDGYADVVIGAAFADPSGRSAAGSAYVVYGKGFYFGTEVDLRAPSLAGFRIDGAAAGDTLGSSVAVVGDITGDGRADILLGTPGTDQFGATDTGTAYAIIGASSVTNLDINAGLGSRGLFIRGENAGDMEGSAVATAGDVNGDGYNDILVTAPAAGNGAGAAYLLFGKAGGLASIDLSFLTASAGIKLAGGTAGDAAGTTASAAGDLNGDGYADIIISAPGATANGRSSSGSATVIYGEPTAAVVKTTSAAGGKLYGGDFDDVLTGQGGGDLLDGRAGDDVLLGAAGADTLAGGEGNDTLNGGAGADSMTGGNGDDVYVVDAAGDQAIELAGGGSDTLFSNLASYTMGDFIEIGRLFGTGAALGVAVNSTTAVQLVVNSTVISTITGGAGADVLWGGTAGSTLDGGPGDDILRDQTAQANMFGGLGNDQFVVGNLGSTITEAANGGTDTAWVTVNGYAVADNVEITRLGGTATQVFGASTDDQIVANPTAGSTLDGRFGNDVLWGSNFADLLNGGAGDDIIRGQGGADTMYGGVGNDQFVVLDPGVIIIENANEGYDTAWIGLNANVNFTLAANVERGNLSGGANRLTGNASDNVLVGNAVASLLDGVGGNDTLFGSAFADTLVGGAGDDILYSGGGADIIRVNAAGWGFDQVSGFQAGAAKLQFTGTSGVTAFGQLHLTYGGGNTQVEVGGNIVYVYGVSLAASDFIFG